VSVAVCVARLPRARPEPRLLPKAGEAGCVGAAGALAVSAGATGVVLVSPDGVVSDMLVCVVLLGRSPAQCAGTRGCCVLCGSWSAGIGALDNCEFSSVAG